MKVLILAGGKGTRLSEETSSRPKPMVELGGWPILWHIMKIYSHYGHNDFIILLGHKGYMIKEYFANYYLHQSNVTIDLKTNETVWHDNESEPWRVTLIDTGEETMTGGRVKRAQPYVGNERFLLTYGDGVSDVDINALIAFHEANRGTITMTGVQPDGRFGTFEAEEGRVNRFLEKPRGDGSWINGGFFVCEPGFFDYLEAGDDSLILERGPFEKAARDGRFYVYHHNGFWKCMDTLRDKNELNKMWESGAARWKSW